MSEHLHWRQKAHRSLEAYFERRSKPRIILTIVLAAAGLLGLLASIGLFHAGVERMWIRYPLAALAGYGGFLGLLRLWAGWEYDSFAPEEMEAALPPLEIGNRSSLPNRMMEKVGEVASHVDPLDAADVALDVAVDGEGCFILFLIVALLGLVITLLCGIFAAPALLAEVFLDAFLITVIYKRLCVQADEHWLRTAVRRTWGAALGIALLFSVAGWSLSHLAPGATSLGDAMRQMAEEP